MIFGKSFIENYSGSEKEFMFISAQYDINWRLLKADAEKRKVNDNDSAKIEISISSELNTSYVKAFVWDENQTPSACETYQFK